MTEKAATDMDTSDLRARVVTLEQQASQKEQRLVNLEAWRQQQDINGARTDEKWNNLEARFTSLDGKITDIGSSLKYINRLVIGGIIAGLIGFMIKGGFNIP